jgi:ABC-type uncharacterized transport system substrate-binding protein
LFLGFFLIALTSSILLMADWNRRKPTGTSPELPAGTEHGGTIPLAKKWKLGLIELTNVPAIEESQQGVLAGLREAGLVEGRDYEIQIRNAQGDTPILNTMVDAAVSEGADMLIVISTLALQAALQRAHDRPIVFTQVTDPIKAGAGRSNEDHLPNVTGSSPLSDHDQMISVIRQSLPAVRRVGTLFSLSEDNAVIQKDALVAAAKKAGIEVEAIGINRGAEIADAALALSTSNIDAVCQISDNLTSSGFAGIVQATRQAQVPLFAYQTAQAQAGAVLAVARDFAEAGKVAGAMAARIMRGESPSAIPFQPVSTSRLVINLQAAQTAGLTLPASLVARADAVIDATGLHEKTPTATAKGGGPARLTKKWHVHLVEFNNVSDVEEAEHGVLTGLRETGLVESRDYDIKIRNAQGDMSTVNSLIDASLTEGADLLITLSTPTLQAALQKARNLPIIFTYVASAVIAGAGRSDTDHLPNVTGVYLGAGYQEILALIREFFPSVRSVGTLFVPSEVNTVYHKDQLTKQAQEVGIEVVAVAASTSAEVPDAALSLCSRQIDALCQIAGNLTASSFPSIAQAAQREKLPIFAFQSSQARTGATVVLARDYGDGGREAGLIAARVMRGEDPASIPFQAVKRTRLIVNLESARSRGLTLPPALIQRADEVIGQ